MDWRSSEVPHPRRSLQDYHATLIYASSSLALKAKIDRIENERRYVR